MARALKLLSYRPRTIKELKLLLLDRNFLEDEINPVISQLLEWGYLNDLKFMESWCHYRQQISPKGRWLVRQELIQKGITVNDLETYFHNFYSESMEKDSVRILLEKKLSKIDAKEKLISPKQAYKIISALQRKGFKYNLIVDTLSQLGYEFLDN